MMDVEHTKALEQKATPGPWVASVVDSPRSTATTAIYSHAHPAGSALSEVLPSYDVEYARSSRISRADAEFIAHARSAVPALVAAVERVQALHVPGPAPSSSKYCCECADLYPCATIKVLERS